MRTLPLPVEMVPTTPCWVKNQIRPFQSGITAIRQSSFGTAPATDQDFSLASEPSGRTATFQICLSTVVG